MNKNLLAFLLIAIYFSPILYQLGIVIKERKKGNKLPLKKLITFSKYSLLILVIISIGIGILSHTNYLNYEKPLAYDQIDKITFENFRGIEFFQNDLYGNKQFAYVTTSIETKTDDNYITVQTLFHPSRSFVYDQHSNNKDLLTHEKYHIKITELYSRKIKKRLSELNYSSNDEIKKIIEQTKQEERTFQKKYDYDTFHSYVYSEQKKYEKEIDSLLHSLINFAKPKIRIHEKN
ncbi:hypothetical protein [Aquimarina aquimarini]|uniref:hypothetical protein n=1 Tax=Aquimarina aquimarini TaxID=1191734 RepID=UPI000D555752|nr:hypothetical protein [Aquimarina aquimarini]